MDGLRLNFFEQTDSLAEPLLQIWNFQIVSIGGRELTIGKFVIAVVVFAVGLVLAKLFSKALNARVYSRFIHEASIRSTLQSLT